MKRFLALALAFLLCFGLTACGDSSPKVPTVSFDSLSNADTGVAISLGMTKTKMEELLGEGTYLDVVGLLRENTPSESGAALLDSEDRYGYQDFTCGDAKDHIMITYENDLAIGISIFYAEDESGSSNWYGKYGLTYGGSAEDMFQHYGKKEAAFPGAMDSGKTLPYIQDPRRPVCIRILFGRHPGKWRAPF